MKKFYTGFVSGLILFLVMAIQADVQAQTTITLGTGTSTASTNAFVSTSTTNNRYSYNFTIYSAAEINSLGGFPGIISKLAWQKEGTGEYTYDDAELKIYLKHVNYLEHTTTLETWADIISNATLVYSSNSFSWPTGTGFKEITLQTPFTWNGTDNLAVLVDWYRDTVPTAAISWAYTSVTNANKWRIGTSPLTDMSQVNSSRANLQITLNPLSACTSPPVPGTTTTDTTGICAGTPVNLNLSGNTFGSGQTHQLQTSPTQAGTYTDVGTSQLSTSFTINPLTTAWYRVAVTCSGNTQYSTPVEVAVNPLFPGGTYTINSASPTGGTNFQSFNDAVSAISCGISGPVVLNIVPSSGPYTEQVSIPEIGGASSTNTVTINGNGNTLQFSPVASNRYILQLNGADYIRINNLNIVSQNATYGWGIHLTNGADHNIITNSTIDISATTSTTIDNSAGIVGSNSLTDLNADGNASFNQIRNNTIIGGYQGIIINGSPGSINAVQNVIDSNEIRDFYAYGIELTDNDSTVISHNNIHRTNRTAVGTFEGIELGVGNKNMRVYANRIHDTHTSASSQTGTAYGIYSTADDAPAGSENLIYNNLIYNFNSTSGSQYGIYNSSSDGIYYYHNTIVLDNASSTGGLTRGFHQVTLASNIQLKNNIIYISRGGTGVKYNIYLSTATSDIQSDYNVLYMGSTAGTNNIGYYSGAQSTLTAWQQVNSGAFDQNSVDVDPMFLSPSTGNFYPNNPAVATMGASLGIPVDIVGVVRPATLPTPGAFQVLISANVDVGAVGLFAPVQQICYSNSETVTVIIRNFSSSVHDFVTSPVTVNAAVTGPNAVTFAPVTINTGTLASGDSLNVVITGSYDMSAAGTYVFSASTSVSGDANAINDAMQQISLDVAALSAGMASSTPEAFCVTGGVPALSLAGSSGGTIQWQESSGASGPWTNVGTDSIQYTPSSAIATAMHYRAIAVCGPNSDTSNIVTVEINDPQLLSTTPAAICGPGTLTLQAAASAGSTINWYTDSVGGTPVGTGTSFTTPNLTSSTTYYVAAASGSSSVYTGRIAPQAGAATTLTTYGLDFTLTQSVTLSSVDVIAVTGSSITVSLYSAGGSSQLQTTGPVSVPSNDTSTIQLGWSLAPGTYRIIANGMTGSFIRENSTVSYPIPLSTVGQINGFVSSITGSVTTSASYYWFYNWLITTGCETPRQSVTATVSPNTAILTQPVTQSVCGGTDVIFFVDAEGANLSYQWFRNGQPIAGATDDTLMLNNVTPANDGSYTVEITGLCGTETSQAANLSVSPGNSWVGLTSNDWHDPANWCGGVPSSTSDVHISAGAPFYPLITGTAEAGNLTLAPFATVNMASGSTLNLHGDFTNAGDMNASQGTIAFVGSSSQVVDTLSAGTIIINGAGITLAGTLTAENTLTLTSGHITLGIYDVNIHGSVNGSVSSHIITNGTGSAHSFNIGTSPVVVPVGPDAATYNPVTISNGQGLNYSVHVATGLNPSITDNSRAINRTWTVHPNTFVTAPVTIALQYADAHANANADPSALMQVGMHNGQVWHNLAGAGVTPTGSSTARVVTYQTQMFGPTVLANTGAIDFQTSLAGIDRGISSVMLMPNLVHSQAVLRVKAERAAVISWVITDASGRVVREFSRQVMAGTSDMNLDLQQLAAGSYQISGFTDKGKTAVVRFVKM